MKRVPEPRADAWPSRSYRAMTRRRQRTEYDSGSDTEDVDNTPKTESMAERALLNVVRFLATPEGLRLYRRAVWSNMEQKRETYYRMTKEVEAEKKRLSDVVKEQINQLKTAAGIKGGEESSSINWTIFESVGDPVRSVLSQQTQFEALRLKAIARRDDVAATEAMRDQLIIELRALLKFAHHPTAVYKVADLIGGFIKDPSSYRKKMMSFMMLGGPGTGKSDIAMQIGRVLKYSGIFIGDSFIEAGRSDLIASYEGQTVHKTRNFLMQNLDAGVIFIDEAYALTPWDNGKPEGYGAEASTAIVEFMVRYRGLYCIIVAGYEKEMMRYFIASNPGLDRRFMHKILLNNVDASELLHIFKVQLMRQQGLQEPLDRSADLEADKYFTPDAYEYLFKVIEQSTLGDVTYEDEVDVGTMKTYENVRKFTPHHPFMYQLFKDQAGSMTNLADEAITVLLSSLPFDSVVKTTDKARNAHGVFRPAFSGQGQREMRRVIEQRIINTALSQSEKFMEDLRAVETAVFLSRT